MLFTTITLAASFLNGAPASTAPAQDEEKAAVATQGATEDAALTKMKEFIETAPIDKKKGNWKTRLPEPPKLEFSADTDYFWHMKTNKGDIKIKFMPDHAPMHVSSTIYLTQLGFYDSLIFHRVIPRFMAQGGCPLGRGMGGPGYKYAGEHKSSVRHDRPGLLSMANAGPRTDGSQFFITFVPTPHLDDKHTIFGEVVDGMDTVKKLEAAGTPGAGRTKEKLVIEKATISTAKKKKKKDG